MQRGRGPERGPGVAGIAAGRRRVRLRDGCADPTASLARRRRPGPAAAGAVDWAALADRIAGWGRDLGFAEVGISDTDLSTEEARLVAWLDAGRHGEMDYMARHGVDPRPAGGAGARHAARDQRADGLPAARRARRRRRAGRSRASAYVARYALGRDYHKVLRARLQRLADAHPRRDRRFRLPRVHRQRAGARGRAGGEGRAGLARQAHAAADARPRLLLLPGRDLHRPAAAADAARQRALRHLHRVHRRLPDRRDRRARTSSTRAAAFPTSRSSSTGAIPEPLRPLLGNRIYGCDDCQLACPWNRYAQAGGGAGLRRAPRPRRAVAGRRCSAGTSTAFLARTAGSAIRRIGFERWSRNLAVALGNAPSTPAVLAALAARADDPSALVREHVAWALARHAARPARAAADGEAGVGGAAQRDGA